MNKSSICRHLAIIMDGNERWARENNSTLEDGHLSGAQNAWGLISSFINLNIPYVTLFSFSSENWQRSEKEKAHLMEIFSYYLHNKVPELNQLGVKLKIIGRIENLEQDLQQKIADSMEMTKDNTRLTLVIAFGYGGRSEIVDACQKVINAGIKNVTEDIFKAHLYDPEMPSVDIMIRTGRTHRISNFLLWELAYAELFFLDKYWPDFKEDDIKSALQDFTNRERRFGSR